MPNTTKTIEPAIVGLVKPHLAQVASTNNYEDLDNIPSRIDEETIIELWALASSSDSDPEPQVNPNLPITNEEIQESWELEYPSNP